MPTGTSVPIPRGEAVIYHPFATATLPTGTSVPIPRREGLFWPLFGTATMPTSTSGASSRGEDGLLSPLVHEMGLSHGRRGPGSGARPDNGIFRIAK